MIAHVWASVAFWLVIAVAALVVFVPPERLLWRLLSAVPTCTLWEYDACRSGYWLRRPLPAIFVGDQEILEARMALKGHDIPSYLYKGGFVHDKPGLTDEIPAVVSPPFVSPIASRTRRVK